MYKTSDRSKLGKTRPNLNATRVTNYRFVQIGSYQQRTICGELARSNLRTASNTAVSCRIITRRRGKKSIQARGGETERATFDLLTVVTPATEPFEKEGDESIVVERHRGGAIKKELESAELAISRGGEGEEKTSISP